MKKFSRREALKIGAGVAGGTALTAVAQGARVLPALGQDGRISRPPDIVVIITDQERYPTHFPDGFMEQTAPSWERLAEHGLTYRRAFTAAAQCSPSRASLLTGIYATEHDVPYLDFPSPVLPAAAELPNIATMLQAVGYDVVWKGKWHLSFPMDFAGGPPSEETWTAEDGPNLEQVYGVADWNPPEAGNNAFDSEGARATFGGGIADNDGRIAIGVRRGDQTQGSGESAVEFLDRAGSIPALERKPFCLFVSFVNPHDIAFYPNGWDTGGYDLADFDGLDIQLPSSADDPLTTKPSIQTAYRDALDEDGPLPSREERLRYVRFYAYLHGVVDKHVSEVLDALDRNGLGDDAVIFRTADHGEQGLAHGLREKSYSTYEESIHVPLVVSNPRLFPEAAVTDALYSHVDLLPTIAELTGAAPLGVGVSQVPVLLDPDSTVQDGVLFTYDDSFILDLDGPLSHIRALRTQRWTYAVYYSADGSAFEYELYDNDVDADQLTNLLFEPAEEIRPHWAELHQQLTELMAAKRAQPLGFDWALAVPPAVED